MELDDPQNLESSDFSKPSELAELAPLISYGLAGPLLLPDWQRPLLCKIPAPVSDLPSLCNLAS